MNGDQLNDKPSINMIEVGEDELFSRVVAALAYRFIAAAGGAAHYVLTELPPEVLLDFNVKNGVATVKAMRRPPSSIVTVPGALADRLKGRT